MHNCHRNEKSDRAELCVEVPILPDSSFIPSLQKVPHGAQAQEDAEDSNTGDPYVQEAWREVVTEGADWTPSLDITA